MVGQEQNERDLLAGYSIIKTREHDGLARDAGSGDGVK